MTSKGIKWDFNAHYAPHFGGVLEAMIKVAKQARMAIFSKADLTDKDLMTPFTGAEALINSKPLAYQSVMCTVCSSLLGTFDIIGYKNEYLV